MKITPHETSVSLHEKKVHINTWLPQLVPLLVQLLRPGSLQERLAEGQSSTTVIEG